MFHVHTSTTSKSKLMTLTSCFLTFFIILIFVASAWSEEEVFCDLDEEHSVWLKGNSQCKLDTKSSEASVMDASADLLRLFDDFWTWRIKESPEFATQVGIHDLDGYLDSYAPEAFDRRLLAAQDFLTRASNIQTQELSVKEKLNLRLLKEELKTYIDGFQYKGFVFPINHLEGVQVDFTRLVEWMKLETVDDFEKLLSRYAAFPKQADEIAEIMRVGMKEGRVNHEVSMAHVPAEFKDLQVAAESSPFYKPFLSIPESISKDTAQTLQKRGLEAVKSQVLIAFKKLGAFIENEYMKKTRKEIGSSALPNGMNFYKQCLKFHTSTDMTPEQVHQMGLDEVKRIESEMMEIIRKLGKDMSVQQFVEELRNNRKFYYDSKEGLLKGFRELAENIIDPKLPEIFLKIPKMKLNIISAPDWFKTGPSAYYLAGSYDGKRPGVFYVNTANYDKQPKYEMVSLALHEGSPGHHLQGSFMAEEEGMPMFRRVMEDRKYSDTPSRFPINTAYVEGWGLYSEDLGDDLGLYKDDIYSKFGHLSMSIYRACRLVVDTGMHALGWSKQQAVDYMAAHTASSLTNIENEVNRYITWPGQACAYKVGEIKLQELRKKMVDNFGDRFDLKKFHDIVLQYAGPLNVLEERINEEIRHPI